MAAQAEQQSGRILQLDILRGVAILLVLGRHPAVEAASAGALGSIAGFWYRFGWSGVDLFFVLSGYLVGGLLFAEIRRNNRLDVRRFLIRRAFKIWPAYYALILFTVIVAGGIAVLSAWSPASVDRIPGLSSLLKSHPEYAGFSGVIPNIFHFQNYSSLVRQHTWSLAVEEHFYLFLPMLLCLAVRKKPGGVASIPSVPIIAVALILICTALRSIPSAEIEAGKWPVFYHTHLRIDGLFFGVLLAYLAQFAPGVLRPLTSRPVLLFGIAAALLLPVAMFEPKSAFVHTIGFTFLYVGYGALLLGLVHTSLDGSSFGRFLSSKPSRLISVIGVYSYSIYLWHIDFGRIPALIFLKAVPSMSAEVCWLVGMSVYVLLACSAGMVLGKLIEMPVLRYRDRKYGASRAPVPGSVKQAETEHSVPGALAPLPQTADA